MKCDTVRDLLLEASPRELRGEGDTEPARHVRECADCRRLALTILGAAEDLSRGLERLLDPGSGEKILEGVRRETGGAAVGEGASVVSLRGRNLWRIGAPLAAAAAVAAVLLVNGGPQPVTPPAPGPPVPPDDVAVADASGLGVEADRRFAVMKTGDPKIHVVWFY